MFYEILELGMLLCFGCSWPLNALKAYRARTAKGTSLPFLLLVETGYVCGIISKLINPNGFHWYVLFFYVLNFCFVGAAILVYIRNKKLDKAANK